MVSFVYDRTQGTTQRVSLDSYGNQVEGSSVLLGISGDGRYALFHSYASDLVPNDTNNALDLFVRDLLLGTKRASDMAFSSYTITKRLLTGTVIVNPAKPI